MKNIIKIDIYDDFNCIADKCSFTCCKGWDIQIDLDTINKWSNHESLAETMKKSVKKKIHKNHVDYNLNMGLKKSCPYLDDKQLCNIVKNYSDEYIPNTCRVYPRQENDFKNRKEYSLTCGCPEVVDLLYKKNGQVKFIQDETRITDDVPMEINIRETMIKIMQMDQVTLHDKLLIIFHMLLSLRDKLVITKEMINQYLDHSYFNTLLNTFHDIKVNEEDNITEINELFLDMVYNYKKEKQFRNVLYDISKVGEKIAESFTGEVGDVLAESFTGEIGEDIVEESLTQEIGEEFVDKSNSMNIRKKRNEFKQVFRSYEKLIEQCIVSKIFYSCISDEMDENILLYQIIITEYLMVKHSAFLKWMGNELNYNTIRDYIVIYSRIIGYNAEGMKEFWDESFDNAIWDFGYLLMLLIY